MEALCEALAAIDPEAFADWSSNKRTTEACEHLVEVAASITAKQLQKLHKEFSAPAAAWPSLPITNQDNAFLALMMALLNGAHAPQAAAALVAALRCPGAKAQDIFHPIVFFELTKVLRKLLTPSAAPAGKKARKKPAARRGRTDDDDDDDDDDDVDMDDDTDAAVVAAPAGSAEVLIDELSRLLQKESLALYPEALSQLIALLAAVGAYAPLRHCCAPIHGEAQETIPAVLKAALPTLSLADGADGAAASKSAASLKACADFVAGVVADATDVCAIGISEEEAGQRAGAALQAVQALLQRASKNAPDRAEPRAQVCNVLSRLLIRLPGAVSARYAGFLWRLSRTAKVAHRTFAAEMAASSLSAALTPGDGRSSRQVFEDGTAQTLWRLLLQRILTDKAPAVRARALSSLAPLLSDMSAEAPSRELLAQVQAPLPLVRPVGATPASTTAGTPAAPNTLTVVGGTPGAAPGSAVPPGAATPASLLLSPSDSLVAAASEMDPSLTALGHTLHVRLVDDKYAVRRAALTAIESWVVASGLPLPSAILQAVRTRCKDTSPNIRKAAAKTLSALLRHEPDSTSVRSAWLAGVLPLLRDSEPSVCDGALDAMAEHVLQPLARCEKKPSRGFESVAWGLLTRLTAESEPLLQHGVCELAKQKRLPAALAATAQAMLAPVDDAMDDGTASNASPAMVEATPVSVGARAAGRGALWAILLELAKQPPAAGKAHRLDPHALSACWAASHAVFRGNSATAVADEAAASTAHGHAVSEAAFALSVLTSLAKTTELPAEVVKSVGADVREQLSMLDASPRLLVPLVQAAAALLPSAQTAGGAAAWAAELMALCEAELHAALPALPADGAEAAVVECAHAAIAKRTATLVITGELAVRCPELLTPSLAEKVKEIALASAAAEAFEGLGDGANGVPPASTASPFADAIAAAEPSTTDAGGMKAAEGALAATAFVTLGKFCLRSEELTNRLLPVFVRELTSHRAAAVRNNALIAMVDLARVHTSMLDRHVPTMARALGDVSPLVRQHATLLLSQLLLEDYIKWKPPLVRAFAVSLVDLEPRLRAASHGCLFDLLLPREPLVAFNNVLPLLFSLNGVVHAPHHTSRLPASERAVVELAGDEQQRRRLAILRSLLAHMDDEHKLKVTEKICFDVLAAVPDGHLSLDDASPVVSDALMLLACKEIKLNGAGGGAAGGGDDADDDGGADGAKAKAGTAAAAKAKILTVVARKAMVESIVPIVIELKRHLGVHRSPLQKDVFVFLRELLRDHKAHLQDIFARDRQLGTEIEFDLRQLANQPPPRALLPLSPLMHTPGAMTPRAPGTSMRTPGSITKDAVENMAVPTPDRLQQMSVPKLRSGASSRGSASRSRDLPSASAAAAAIAASAAIVAPSPSSSGPAAHTTMDDAPEPMAPPPARAPKGKAAAAKSKAKAPAAAEDKAAAGGTRRSRRAAAADTADVVMPSPLKDAPPPKQWTVSPSPGLFDDL